MSHKFNTEIMKTKKINNVNGSLIQQFGIDSYKPRAKEKYMSKRQLNHFTKILNAWKAQLEDEAGKTVDHMQKESNNLADPNDRASKESEFGLELRTRDRERKLLRKIQTSLNKIKSGNYGYCDETGEEIGLKRLEARPVASLTLEAQERREISDKQYSDAR